MALVEFPTTPKRGISRLFSPSNSSSSLSSLSNQYPHPPSTISESMMDENIQVAEAMITKWDVQGSTVEKFISLFHENRKEAREFINCVNDLRRAMHFYVSQRSPASSKLVPAQNLMKMAMHRLEQEFYQILSANKAYLDPESVSRQSSRLSSSSNDENQDSSDSEIQRVGEAISEVERLSELAMSDLRMIADCMIRSGYTKECIKIYKLIRKSIVDEGLYRLGIERYSSSQINKMNASDLENQVKTWLRGVKIAVKTLLHGERLLCDYVFSTSETIRESCFASVAKEGATNLFRLPELVVKNKKLPERVFLLMDLQEALSDVFPDIETIFSYQSVSSVQSQALSSIQKLGDAVLLIIAEFESSIHKNSSKILVPGGGIHPLTISVMDYVSKLANYTGVLSSIIPDSTPATQVQFPETYFDSPVANETPTSAASVRLAWIILVLLCKLDTKAENYNDIALTYLFLANNLRFVLAKVHHTALRFILGNDWIAKLERKIKVFSINYEIMAWGNVLGSLPENVEDEMSPQIVKEYFRRFNAAFDEAYRKQASWVIPNGKLRVEIKQSIARKMVPAYGEFYNRHIETLEGEGSFGVLVRFSPDNLGNYLSDILHGTDDSEGSEGSSPLSTPRASRYLK